MAVRSKAPRWFWLVAGLITLWGVVGVAAFYMDLTMSPAAVAAMSDYDRALRASRPGWFMWLYGAAVWTGLIGGVLLLARSALAQPVLLASLVLVIAMFGYIFAVTDLIAVKGVVGAAGFPIVIAAIAVVQVWCAARARQRGWIV
ncbi:hypothetical protein [Sphingomonas sp. PB4P5]|uniref:hypothetical protein n=1 Tax=Parasphingomonas puruogangriensis TaxID=3096155 RepID=UPI002FCA5E93